MQFHHKKTPQLSSVYPTDEWNAAPFSSFQTLTLSVHPAVLFAQFALASAITLVEQQRNCKRREMVSLTSINPLFFRLTWGLCGPVINNGIGAKFTATAGKLFDKVSSNTYHWERSRWKKHCISKVDVYRCMARIVTLLSHNYPLYANFTSLEQHIQEKPRCWLWMSCLIHAEKSK